MRIIAKGISDTIELDEKNIIIKGVSTFGLKKQYHIEYDGLKIVKYKKAGKIMPGILKIEVWKKRQKRVYSFNYKYEELDSFDNLVEILQYGYSEKNMICKANGIDGVIELYKDKIIIKRDSNNGVGFWAHGLKGDKEIWLEKISAIQLKMPGTLTRGMVIKGMEHNGYIQFAVSGSLESKGGIIGAAGDENTVFFSKEQADDFCKLKELIAENKSDIKKVEVSNYSTNERDQISLLRDLAKLKEDGIITEEEFSTKKKQILGL